MNKLTDEGLLRLQRKLLQIDGLKDELADQRRSTVGLVDASRRAISAMRGASQILEQMAHSDGRDEADGEALLVLARSLDTACADLISARSGLATQSDLT